MKFLKTCALAAVVAMTGVAASAATITGFSDGFEGEAPGSFALNFNSFTNWDVSDGTVDLINSGSFGITCQSSTWCVDLDGSTGNAGKMTTKDTFAAGNYVLTFGLSGNQRGGADDTVTIMSFGDLTESITMSPSDPWMTFTRNVTLTSDSTLMFEHAGGDNLGLILDNVNVRRIDVSAIPLPAGVWLMGLGIGSLALMRRRSKKTADA